MKSPRIRVDKGDCSVQWHYTTGQVESLTLCPEAKPFRWIRGIFGLPTGMCYLDKREDVEDGIRHVYEYMTDLRLTVDRVLDEEGYTERYLWRNVGKKPLEIASGEVGVYATFAEQYDIRQVTVPYRAYTHVMAGGKTFYVYNARFDGTPGGVGLVLTEGRVADVAYERLNPHQKGDVILNMPACTLAPDETFSFAFRVFYYRTAEEFWAKVAPYAHRIEVCPRLPEVGQEVSVRVDGTMPATVLLDGVAMPNPFRAPAGQFVLSPIVEDAATAIAMSAAPHVVRWAQNYRGLGRNKKSPLREAVCEAVAYHTSFLLGGDSADKERATAALGRYYAHLGAYRTPQAFMPAALIKGDEALTAMFARHVQGVLRSNRRAFGADEALAEYSMLLVANEVFEGRYADALSGARALAAPLLHTPFGPLYEGEDVKG